MTRPGGVRHCFFPLLLVVGMHAGNASGFAVTFAVALAPVAFILRDEMAALLL